MPWSFAIACSNTSIFHYSLIINSIHTPTIGHNEYVMRSKLTTQFGILPFGFLFIVRIVVGSVVKLQYLYHSIVISVDMKTSRSSAWYN